MPTASFGLSGNTFTELESIDRKTFNWEMMDKKVNDRRQKQAITGKSNPTNRPVYAKPLDHPHLKKTFLPFQ